MANRKLTVTAYIMRDSAKIKLDELSEKEQKMLANKWNRDSMEAAGFTVTYPPDKVV